MEKQKKRWGDRKDGVWLRDIDAMHAVMPYFIPHRSECEAMLKETLDISKVLAYLNAKNAGRTDEKYTLFQFVACVAVKVITQYPQMNRFYQGHRLYQREHISVAFTIKKKFDAKSEEAMSNVSFGSETTMDSLHDRLTGEINTRRKDNVADNSTNLLRIFMKFPRWILRPAMFILHRLDYFGKIPEFMVATEPHYATVYIANLGSIGLDAAFHHLTNWGTNSIFVTIGKIHEQTETLPDGSVRTFTACDFALTLDERIVDGYYYAQAINLAIYLFAHPELLDKIACEEVEMI